MRTSVIFSIFNTHFLTDITPEMLKLGRFTKVKVLFLVLIYVFNFNLFEFSAAILEKGLLIFIDNINIGISLSPKLLPVQCREYASGPLDVDADG